MPTPRSESAVDNLLAGASAATEPEKPKRRYFRRALGWSARQGAYWIPFYAYAFLAYVLLHVFVDDVRSTVFTYGRFTMTWVEPFYAFAALLALLEHFRVSHPGIDHTSETWVSILLWVLTLLAFALGCAGVEQFSILCTTEFAVLLIIAFVQNPVALKINARVLRRTLEQTRGS